MKWFDFLCPFSLKTLRLLSSGLFDMLSLIVLFFWQVFLQVLNKYTYHYFMICHILFLIFQNCFWIIGKFINLNLKLKASLVTQILNKMLSLMTYPVCLLCHATCQCHGIHMCTAFYSECNCTDEIVHLRVSQFCSLAVQAGHRIDVSCK